jgi:peptide/nickel transport system substrate-binding protein
MVVKVAIENANHQDARPRSFATRASWRVAVAVLAVATMTACTSPHKGGSSGATSGTADARTPEIVVANADAITTIDPHSPQGGGAGPQLAERQIFSRLVKLNPDGTLSGDLATAWNANADVTQWTFTLRQGVKFSDGKALTAADVVDSFQRFVDLKGTAAATFRNYTMTATSGTEVLLTAPKSDAAIPRKLTAFYVLPSGVAAADTAFFAHPVGTGPFKLETFAANEVMLVPNATYYGGAPTTAKVTIRTMPDLASRLTALRAGEVDLVWGIPDDQLPQLQGDSRLTVGLAQSSTVFTVWFNLRNAPLNDVKIRRALRQAIDFPAIIQQLYPQTGASSDSVVSPQTLGYAAQPPIKYDPDAAKAGLTVAGQPLSARLRLEYADDELTPFSQAVAADLQKVNVNLDLVQKPPAELAGDLQGTSWQMAIQQLSDPTLDGANTLGRYFCGANSSGYCNPQVDALLTAALKTSDEKKRAALYADATKMIWGDAVGMFPMTVKTAYAWNKRLSGVQPEGTGLPDLSLIRVGS